MLSFCNAMIALMEQKIMSGFYQIGIQLSKKEIEVRIWNEQWIVTREIPMVEIESYVCPEDLARIYFEEMMSAIEKE